MSRLRAAIARAKASAINTEGLVAVRDAWLAELVDATLLRPNDFDACGALSNAALFSLQVCTLIEAEAQLGAFALNSAALARGWVAILAIDARGRNAMEQHVLADVVARLAANDMAEVRTVLAVHNIEVAKVVLHADTADALLDRLNAALAEPLATLPAPAQR